MEEKFSTFEKVAIALIVLVYLTLAYGVAEPIIYNYTGFGFIYNYENL